MSFAVLVLIVLLVGVGIVCLAGCAWMLRSLRWEVVEDDDLHDHTGRKRAGALGWLTAWLRPKALLLTYRRDERGRFRRHRR